jgi:hypothetical protein
MTLDTAESMYKYFLSEIRKSRTIVITPSQWTAFVNPVLIDWVKTKLPEVEFNQKRIDDLEAIKVLTDGVSNNILTATSLNTFDIPLDGIALPKYMYGLSAAFGYTTSTTKPVVLDRSVAGKILRANQRVVYGLNPYRQPDDVTYIYFEQRGGKIYCTPKALEWNKLILEYYSYPVEIFYEGISSTDNAGSFEPIQNKEIIDMAVTRYLEKASDQRIQTQPQVSASVPK